ncbi:VIT domain-containing protein [Piscinibacter defluvii]|uniref:VIT domain-containing protein n=1 Tax=Piscinibacter defluvii TaxID=1796922 RepID=UPI000FDF41E0|nr:VIT domain-containing protein [Piscinibacter defluvii]
MPESREHAFQLCCRHPAMPAPVLTGVRLEGRLDAVLFEQTLQQSYRNDGPRVLEVVYTFPLPAQAVLLGFASTLNGRRLEGVVTQRGRAEARYEAALDEGDAPVLLEALGDGLYTANVGNLQPGDELAIELRFAELLRFEQGRLRIAIPTTIAPRYGDAGAAGLQPQQVPESRLDVEYPLECRLAIGAALAGATVECPTHAVTLEAAGGERCLRLAGRAFLDRDLVVLVTPREPRPSLLVQGHDAAEGAAAQVRLAALQLPAATADAPVALKLLVDCSGSMAGAAIDSARSALRGLLASLDERDRVALTRFGSSPDVLAGLAPAGAATLRRLAPAVDGLQADLGGTEMAAALEAAFAQPGGAADVLLITDGEIWDTDGVVAAARRGGQRVFVIGVGHSPAEAPLRRLAEATGGACEFATPGEALALAAQRMLQRMRQPRRSGLRIDWGAEPAWQLPLPQGLFDGDTLFACAGFARAPAAGVRLLDGAGQALAATEAQAPVAGDTLARLAAARRWAEGGHDAAFAVRYQLLTDQTHCVLVHERAAAQKAGKAAELHRVASMGLFGALEAHIGASPEMRLKQGGAVRYALGAPRRAGLGLDALDGEVRLSICAGAPDTLREMLARAAADAAAGRSPAEVAERLVARTLHDDVQGAIQAACRQGLDLATAVAALLRWILSRPGAPAVAALAAWLDRALAAAEPAALAAARAEIEALLSGCTLDGWTSRRAQRLRQALGRAGGVSS